MLWIAGVASGAEIDTYDPQGWATWGAAPSMARELADPATTAEVARSGLLNLGFGSADIGGGALLRAGTGRFFFGVDGEGSTTDVAESEADDHATLLPAQLDLAYRRGSYGVAVELDGMWLSAAASTDGPYVVEDDVESGVYRGGTFDGRVLGQWGPTEGSLRPRLGIVLMGSGSAETVEVETDEESFSGDATALPSETPLEWAGFGNEWAAGGGVRAGLDAGGDNASPRLRAWAEVTAEGTGLLLDGATYRRTVGDTVQEDVWTEDASGWRSDTQVGVVRKVDGAGAALWVGGRIDVGIEQEKRRDTYTIDAGFIEPVDGLVSEAPEARQTVDLAIEAAGFLDLSTNARLWVGVEPSFGWVGWERPGTADYAGFDVSWTGRSAVEWHHPSGVVAALAVGLSGGYGGYSSSVSSLFTSSTSLWVGWMPT